MADERIRRQITILAAQLMYDRTETEYFTAKRKAARQVGINPRYQPQHLPSNREIQEQLRVLAELHEGDRRKDVLREMRVHALRIMRLLERFRPRLIGSVWTGHIRKGSDIDIHIFSDNLGLVSGALDDYGVQYEVEKKRIVKFNEERHFTHIHVHDRFPVELTMYPTDKINYTFKSSITGKAIEGARAPELEKALHEERPAADLQTELDELEEHMDRFEWYRMLLLPLEEVKQNARHHPEGDALYHSLQVFELARETRPYDEEFLLAALLHDIGKAIDRSDHTAAGLSALEGTITERTQWLIAHHMDALAYRDGSIGIRRKRKLEQNENFEDLMLLRRCDDAGRQPGRIVDDVEDVLEYIRSLE